MNIRLVEHITRAYPPPLPPPPFSCGVIRVLTTLKIAVSTFLRLIGNSSVIIVSDQPAISDVGFGIYRYGTMRELWDATMRLL